MSTDCKQPRSKPATSSQPSSSTRRIHSSVDILALTLVFVSVIPYGALKLSWIFGSTIGLKNAATIAEVQSQRMLVGNVATIVLEGVAVVLAVALACRAGTRIPPWLLTCIGAGATGLLAPILLGLPFGSLVQFLVDGNVETAGMSNISPWVFFLVYGGFGVLAIALALLLWGYVLDRWRSFIDAQPPRPDRVVVVIGALGLLPFSGVSICWALFGPGSLGPSSMTAISQRFVLGIIGILILVSLLAPLIRGGATAGARAKWIGFWLGISVAIMQPVAFTLLADGGRISAFNICLTAITVPTAVFYGGAVITSAIRDGRGDKVGARYSSRARIVRD